MRGARRGNLALIHAVRNLADALGRLAGDDFGRFARLERVRIGEDLAQYVEVHRVGEAVEVKRIDLFRCPGEIGVDLESIEVAHDQ